ncbi:GNAT family N-acetyltransferase [Parenemella sanctibonifatiensis]|uniref:GNAT family N-acetyltransferase n=1 Tax=Parenemella sanctibonifatiensis TaxID=2016505 RepID=UPI0015C5E3CD|nr:GNAT family N-acetyltransferase [Parenemella sanctibonifatiensis]
MTVCLRPLTAAHHEAGLQLRHEAFGAPRPADSGNAPVANTDADPGRHWWGHTEADALLSRGCWVEYGAYFGGVEVPNAGLAGITIAAEARGQGLLKELLAVLWREAREAGRSVSTFFPTAPGIYRSAGCEVIADKDTIRLPLAGLSRLKPAPGVRLSRGSTQDVAAVQDLYARAAARTNGALTRTGVRFTTTAADLLAEFTGLTMAWLEDEPAGYLLWDRTVGDHATGPGIAVEDFVSVHPDATRALLGGLASFAAVTDAITIDAPAETLRWALPAAGWEVIDRRPYMLKVIDPVGSLTARTWPELDLELSWQLVDPLLSELTGGYRLRSLGGSVEAEPTEVGDAPCFTAGGWALLFAGAATTGQLRLTGQLTGPADQDRLFDALVSGYRPAIHDYF